MSTRLPFFPLVSDYANANANIHEKYRVSASTGFQKIAAFFWSTLDDGILDSK